MLTFLEEKQLYELSQNILKNLDIEKNFQSISILLQNKNFILSNQKFLNLLNIQLNPYKLRIFLSSIIIKYCPDDILQERKEIEENLIKNASELFDSYLYLLKDQKNKNEIEEKINNYLILFQIWKEQDMKKFIFVLSSTYNELIITSKIIEETKYKTDEEKQRARIWCNEIENQKKSLEKAVYQIGGENGIEKMINGTFWLDMVEPEFRILIENNLKKSFRKKLVDELQSDKIPYTLIKCLKEIQNKTNKNLKIEILNLNLNKHDKMNIIKYNLEIFEKKINLDMIDEIVDNLLDIYQNLGK